MIRRFRDLASREPGSVLAGLFALALACSLEFEPEEG
jgi:hypothetical protein